MGAWELIGGENSVSSIIMQLSHTSKSHCHSTSLGEGEVDSWAGRHRE